MPSTVGEPSSLTPDLIEVAGKCVALNWIRCSSLQCVQPKRAHKWVWSTGLINSSIERI